MGRRTITLRYLALALVVLALQGCGFQLKQGATISNSLSPMFIEGLPKYHNMRTALIQYLDASNIQVVDQNTSANSILKISNYENDRRVLSVDGNGKVAEYELHEAATFELLSGSGSSLVKQQRVSTTLTYLNSETEVLGKQQEEGTLRADMRLNLADRILRRIDSQL